MRPTTVLVVDDERNIRRALRVCLESLRAEVTEASSVAEALEANGRTVFDVVLLDLRLGTRNGLDLIPLLLAENTAAAIVVITAYPTSATAVEAFRRGASGYLAKPFTPAQIRELLEKVEARRSPGVRDDAPHERRVSEKSDADPELVS
jgi:two-component system, NtrC family, response regulator AlgB